MDSMSAPSTMNPKIDIKASHHPQCLEVLRKTFGDRPIRGIEIGTMAGDLTKALLHQLPNLELLISVDPWTHRKGAQFEAGNPQEFHDRQRRDAHHKCAEWMNGPTARCGLWQMSSNAAFNLLCKRKADGDKPFDFVWIDGDHTYEQVVADIENGLVLLPAGALIGGHDYGLVGDVTRAVKELIEPHYTLHAGGDFTWWAKR